MLKPLYQEVFKAIKSKNFSFLFLAIVLFLLPLSINFSSIFLLLSILLKLMQVIFFNHKLFANNTLKQSAILGLAFFVYIVSDLLIQAGFQPDFKFFEKDFSKFVLLFLTPLILKGKEENNLLIVSFFIGISTAILFSIGLAVISRQSIDRHIFETVLDFHHTYLGLSLMFLINKLLFFLLNNNKKQKLEYVSVVGLILLFFIIIYLIDSKVSMLLFILLFIFHLVSRISKKNVIKYFTVFGILMISFVFFNKKASVSYERAMDFRLQIWEAGIEIVKENLIFGQLNQSEKEMLNYQHFLDGKYYFLDSDLNVHNQYLSFLMRFGIIGFLLFVLYVSYSVKLAYQNKHRKQIQDFFGFTIIIMTVFYVENILSRHHGIVFFTVFYNYYLVRLSNEEN